MDTTPNDPEKDWPIEFIDYIVQHLVDHPQDIKIKMKQGEPSERHPGTPTQQLELHTHPDDRGKVIGKEGHTIRALRSILRAAAARDNRYIQLELYEPEGSRRPQREHGHGGKKEHHGKKVHHESKNATEEDSD